VKRAWDKAAELARATPPQRNRAADLLRALSIGVVVFGHWLMAAPYVDADGRPHAEHVLAFAPWTHWLTWGLQVMPVFFFVGGYSNALSWESALKKGRPFGEWLRGRAERLLAPVLPVVLLWAVLGAAGHACDVPPDMIAVASISALIPTWFLAVYLLVIPLVPLARAAWRRFGLLSALAPAGAAALVDLGYFRYGLHGPGWINYLLVWLAVHQLGFAWLHGSLASRRVALAWAVGGLALLLACTELGPWPRSLVGVPGAEFSNTTPPHLPVLALTAFQFGVARLCEPGLNRLLARPLAWTATVLVNGLIMTIFLWHSTVMMLAYGASLWLADGLGMHALPGTGGWWLAKIPWVLAFSAILLVSVGPLSLLERVPKSDAKHPPPWLTIAGCLFACAGLAQLTLGGVGGDGPFGLRLVPLALPWIGAELAGLGPLGRALRR
jgi:hypothetical protein